MILTKLIIGFKNASLNLLLAYHQSISLVFLPIFPTYYTSLLLIAHQQPIELMMSLMKVVGILQQLFIAVVCQYDWKQGRGTFYGNEWWAWNIHEGSCQFGFLCPEEGTGWDIAALPDAYWGYLGSCGRCYEVKCLPSVFKDNYGEQLDRAGVCYDPEASVVVTITDTCPCNYASNWYSNQRWCCGDMDHFDLSVWTFEKLAETKWGVIGLQYRQVACDYQPNREAPEPEQIYDPSPIPQNQACPTGNFPLRKNWKQIQYKYRNLYSQKGQYFSNEAAITWEEYNDWYNKDYDNQGYDNDKGGYSTQADALKIDPKPTADVVFRDGITTQWKTETFHTELSQKSGQGLEGGDSICGVIKSGGIFDFTGPAGSLSQKMSLELWVKSDNGTPDLDVNIGSNEGFCAPVRITDLYTSGSMDGFSRYDIYLGLFNTPRDETLLWEKPGLFNGCFGLDAHKITTVQVRNNRLFDQSVCMDEIKLLG
eukprot:TRINITY_DN5093_c0_g1_i1.p2 TRINITY_DN5093_c0_g1~~TRINITY_DN5093_c0_g1_i1.p2  ORF type:complete len:481 (-),score=36.76 TRINITY_DN5093_c0_g1_i1:2346-3788(-)